MKDGGRKHETKEHAKRRQKNQLRNGLGRSGEKRSFSPGFTLIELIVVIAILGILASVGTVAYSGYIKRAHKGVDEQLIADVAYSMYLAAYSDTNFLEGDAYVVGLQYGEDPALCAVSSEGTAENPPKLTNALEMAFGTGCTTDGSLQLSYEDWTLGAVSGLLTYQNSVYAGNEESLLNDIQVFTNSLSTFLENGNHTDMVLNAQGSEYAEFLKSLNAMDAQSIANATTLYISQYAANKSAPEEYAKWWASGLSGEDKNVIPGEIWEAAERLNNGGLDGNYDATGDIMAFYAAKVAAAEAVYQYISRQGAADENLTTLFHNVQTADGLTSLMNAETTFSSTVKNDPRYQPYYQDWTENSAANDAKAYINCLKAINESADAFSGNLSNNTGDLYTDGTALNLVTSYVSTAEAVTAAGLNEDSNAVAITVCRDKNGSIVVRIYKNGETQIAGAGNGDETIVPTTQANVAWNVSYAIGNGFWHGTASPEQVTVNVGDTLTLSGTVSYDTLIDSVCQENVDEDTGEIPSWEELKGWIIAEDPKYAYYSDTDWLNWIFGETLAVAFKNDSTDRSTTVTGQIVYNEGTKTATIIVQKTFDAAGSYICNPNYQHGPTNLTVTVE